MNTPLHSLFSHPFIERLGWTLAHSLWQGSGLALLLALALRLLHRAGHRHAACLGFLVAMLACSLITFQRVTIPGNDSPRLHSRQDISVVSQTARFGLFGAGASSALQVTKQQPNVKEIIDANVPWLSAAWMFGVVLLSLKQGLAWMHLGRWRRRHCEPVESAIEGLLRQLCIRFRIRRAVRILQCPRATTPLLVGWLRPVIILPTAILGGLSREQLEAILAHELAHLSRGDGLILWLQRAMETLYFFHPGVRWMSRRLQIEREHRCDDLAVANGTGRETLAAALGKLALWDRPEAVDFALAATGHRPVLDRMRRLLQPTPPPGRVFPPLTTVGSLLSVTVLAWLVAGWNHPLLAQATPVGESPVYAASVRVVLQSDAKANNVNDAEGRAEFRATQIEILESGELQRRALERVRGLHPELKEIKVSVHAARVKETSLIEVTAEAAEPRYTKVYVNALADEYMAFRQEMVEKSVGMAMNKIIEEVLSREKDVKKKAEARDNLMRTPAEKKGTDEYRTNLKILEDDYKRTYDDYQDWKRNLDKLEKTLHLSTDFVGILERPSEAKKVK